MSRMYFSFESNLEPSKEDIPSPVVDYITFENKETGFCVSVSCNMESDFYIDEDRCYQARFKGLDCSEPEEHEITDEDMELLKDAVPTEIQLYIPDEYPAPEEIMVKNLNIDIDHIEGRTLSFHADTFDLVLEMEKYKEEVER